MAKKFDLYQELVNEGFEVQENDHCLVKEFHMECEICWYGKQDTAIVAEIWFNEEHTVCKAYYYYDYICRSRQFKEKTHLAEKRAFNAIKATIENKGFEF